MKNTNNIAVLHFKLGRRHVRQDQLAVKPGKVLVGVELIAFFWEFGKNDPFIINIFKADLVGKQVAVMFLSWMISNTWR